MRTSLSLAAVGALAACAAQPAQGPAMIIPPPQLDTIVPTDDWVGQWNGPEGTFLRIAGAQGRYEVTIQNLDGPRRFPGRSAGDRIEFDRDGTLETLHPTRGVETGMKWLSDKTNCLTVRRGEGYCRD